MSELSTSSIGEVRIALRDDIVFRQQRFGGESCYVIEDPANSQFHRIGVAEYTLISMLDGSRTLSDVMHGVSTALGRDAFTETDVAGICRWLVESGLAKTNSSVEVTRFQERLTQQNWRQRQQSLNPIMAKVPVFCPEAMLDRVAPGLMWLTSTPTFLAWCVVVLSSAYQLFAHWDQLSFDTSMLISSENWLTLGVTWLALKLIHESSHALFCRKYGGEVREAGLLLIALAPIFYVDVTSSWRFTSKWQRIAVATAGMYAELFVGAVATLLWIHSPSMIVQQCALNVVLLSAVTTVLFNANPLMRFDGYYILSDLLEIPNLAPQGQEYLSYLGRRYFYGVRLTSPFETWWDGWPIRIYAVLARIWQVFITASIAILAATLCYGAGLALVAIGIVFMIGIPAYRHVNYLLFGNYGESPNQFRVAVLSASGTILCASLGYLAPWPFTVKAPAVVDYAPHGTVHAGTSGFVKEVLVRSGQNVQANQPLAILENTELEAELKQLQFAIAASKTRTRIAGSNADIIGQQLEFETTRSLQQQLAERQSQSERLMIRAPLTGRVITSDVDALVGTFLREGDELLAIGNEETKELVLSIAQEDAELFSDQVGKPVTVKIRGRSDRIHVDLTNVEPNAALNVEYASITAAAGGCVPVRRIESGETASKKQPWEFVEPRITGSIELTPKTSQHLQAGQLAMVKLPTARTTLGRGIFQMAERWLRTKWRLVHDSQHI